MPAKAHQACRQWIAPIPVNNERTPAITTPVAVPVAIIERAVFRRSSVKLWRAASLNGVQHRPALDPAMTIPAVSIVAFDAVATSTDPAHAIRQARMTGVRGPSRKTKIAVIGKATIKAENAILAICPPSATERPDEFIIDRASAPGIGKAFCVRRGHAFLPGRASGQDGNVDGASRVAGGIRGHSAGRAA